MPDAQKAVNVEIDDGRHGEVESLASQVLAALAQRSGLSGASLDEAILTKFCADILQGGSAISAEAVADLRRQGVNIGAILDSYIPAAARELGARWCRDELSFADVTIGAARLQAILRELSAPWVIDAAIPGDAPNVMLVVPLEEYHTLGGMAAASQMRRMGLSVCLCLGLTEEEILQKVESREFDMIAISLCCNDKLESVRKLVSRLRGALSQGIPIVIGGLVATAAEDVCALTGADFASTDPKEALRHCGVRIPATGQAERATRG
jgi:methanogenic corrinoid protein MtbC1